MTLTEKIAALPEWPESPRWIQFAEMYPAESVRQERERHITSMANAALARLALVAKMIKAQDMTLVQHSRVCASLTFKNGKCDCGRAALLKALEAPE